MLRDTRGAHAAVVVENNREAIELLELVARASLNFSQLKNAIRGLSELYTNVGEILTGAHHEPVPVMQNDCRLHSGKACSPLPDDYRETTIQVPLPADPWMFAIRLQSGRFALTPCARRDSNPRPAD